ncbi:hypothetical protein [Microcoleus sp. F4-D5]|uniref:hypothetical protein n=1 Tax=Microcoleus sp. F4-D5 TaxID=2818760 RepID=UPI002FCFBCB7
MVVLKVQSDRVNVRVGAEVADYLYRMAAGNLKSQRHHTRSNPNGRTRATSLKHFCLR